MDAMAFGMGCCCLQVTMQCFDEMQSRFLHDQLAVFAPLLQALSASSPIFKGMLSGLDTRWSVISQAVDDRTAAERGLIAKDSEGDPLLVGRGLRPLAKSRYSSVSLFLGPLDSSNKDKMSENQIDLLNDVPVEVDEDIYSALIEETSRLDDDGKSSFTPLDRPLARHIAHLFTRDPLVIFDDLIHINNRTHLDHFENIQSTNWRSMRWKLPSLRVGLEFERLLSSQQATASTTADVSSLSSSLSRDVHSSVALSLPPLRSSDDYDFDHNILMEDEGLPGCETEKEELMERIVADGSFDGYPPLQRLQRSSSTDRVGSLDSSNALLNNSGSADLQNFGPGWRVEFRPLEVQLTDFENAAYAIFTVLLSRCLVAGGHNFYLPMSLVEENMKRAQMKDAVLTQKFFIRRNAVRSPLHRDFISSNCSAVQADLNSMDSKLLLEVPSLADIDVAELSLNEIFNGENCTTSNQNTTFFPGILPMLMTYIHDLGCDDRYFVTSELKPYLELFQLRASGTLPTTARYLRTFVEQHPEYRYDGLVSPHIANDLLKHCEEIGMGRLNCPELYGNRRLVPNLDLMEEEDLMFSNFTCFVKPVEFPSSILVPTQLSGIAADLAVIRGNSVETQSEIVVKNTEKVSKWKRSERNNEEKIRF